MLTSGFTYSIITYSVTILLLYSYNNIGINRIGG